MDGLAGESGYIGWGWGGADGIYHRKKRVLREHRHGKGKGREKKKRKKKQKGKKKKKITYGEKALSRSASNWCAEAFLNVGRACQGFLFVQ